MLIVDIGIAHLGSIHAAKELIKTAHESGADLIKAHAFIAKDMKGSMSREFYQYCQFAIEEYIELIQYARELKTDLFYSIYSKELNALFHEQQWVGVSTSMVDERDYDFPMYKKYDSDFLFITVPEDWPPVPFEKANILYSPPFKAKYPGLKNIETLYETYRRDIGFADACVGIDTCLKAANVYGVTMIEKKMCIKKEIYHGNKRFDEIDIYATPLEIEQLAFGLEKIHSVTRH